VNSAEATVISSEAALKQAKIARQEYLEGTFKTEERAILSEIAVAQQDLRTAELSLASAERLAAKGTLKSLQVEAEQFSVQNARNQLDAAEGRLSVLRELTKEKMLVQFDSDIETAKARLDADRSSEIEEKDKLTELVSQIAACLIVSPTDGQVVHANKFSSRGGNEFVVEAGATVREQQTIINLPDPTMMQVKAKINESRITLVKEGMATKIKVSAVPNELLGQVTKVNKYAEPGSWFSSAVKEYATEVQIKNPPENIRTGMTAEVRIFVEQLDNALQIPVLGVYEVKGHHFTLVSTATGYETKEIMIGATNDKFVTIDDGLSEGDNIVLNPRQHLDLMDIPEIETNTNREEMKEIAADGASDAAEKESDRTDAESDRTRPGSGGPPNGGAPGGKPGAGMSADAIAGMMMQRMDTNSDGKITQEEASSNERMNSSFSDYDSNGDGSIDKSEVGAQLKKAMEQRGGGR
jgi:multidrug resistance efflux pump